MKFDGVSAGVKPSTLSALHLSTPEALEYIETVGNTCRATMVQGVVHGHQLGIETMLLWHGGGAVAHHTPIMLSVRPIPGVHDPYTLGIVALHHYYRERSAASAMIHHLITGESDEDYDYDDLGTQPAAYGKVHAA